MTGQQLAKAAYDGDAAKVSTLLSTPGAQSFINYQDAHGSTPLHAAAENGHATVTEKLIAARCNVDLQNKAGATPLHLAAEDGHAAVMRQLLKARFNVDLRAEDGTIPLHLAAAKGHATVTTQLISARSNVNLQTKDLVATPLHWVAGRGHEAKQLLGA